MSQESHLLKEYARANSQDAFRALVAQHVNLVYSVALRQVNFDEHLARDVSQEVFCVLAKKARALPSDVVLGGWLVRCTRFVATDMVRREARRRSREEEAMDREMNTDNTGVEQDWESVRPLLDEAISQLKDSERAAVWMRYFEKRSFKEIGEHLKIRENTARMKVTRSLDKLNGLIARKGITSTAAALGIAIGGHAGVSAPAGLIASITNAVIASGAAGISGSVVGGIIGIMNTTKLVTLTSLATAAVAVGIAVHQGQKAAETRKEAKVAQSQIATLESELGSLRNRLEQSEAELETRTSELAELEDKVQGPGTSLAIQEADPNEPTTRETVLERYRKADDLVKAGQYEAALQEYLWCFDVGMVEVQSFSGVRGSFLISKISDLSARLPEARAALLHRREHARELILQGGSNGKESVMTLTSINRNLGETDATMALYDELPEDHPSRRFLGITLSKDFIKTQRYEDAAANTSLARAADSFERMYSRQINSEPSDQKRELMTLRNREFAVKRAADDIEALAGSGKTDAAVELAARVLSKDYSVDTVDLISKRLERAGQGQLIEQLLVPTNQ